jgi:hypothetical protein
MKKSKENSIQNSRINPLVGEIPYKKAIEFILKIMKANKIGEKIPLTQFCREHNINYQIFLNIKNNGKGQYPAVIAKVLESLGYKITVKKEIQYKYVINQTTNTQASVNKNGKKHAGRN